MTISAEHRTARHSTHLDSSLVGSWASKSPVKIVQSKDEFFVPVNTGIACRVAVMRDRGESLKKQH